MRILFIMLALCGTTSAAWYQGTVPFARSNYHWRGWDVPYFSSTTAWTMTAEYEDGEFTIAALNVLAEGGETGHGGVHGTIAADYVGPLALSLEGTSFLTAYHSVWGYPFSREQWCVTEGNTAELSAESMVVEMLGDDLLLTVVDGVSVATFDREPGISPRDRWISPMPDMVLSPIEDPRPIDPPNYECLPPVPEPAAWWILLPAFAAFVYITRVCYRSDEHGTHNAN